MRAQKKQKRGRGPSPEALPDSLTEVLKRVKLEKLSSGELRLKKDIIDLRGLVESDWLRLSAQSPDCLHVTMFADPGPMHARPPLQFMCTVGGRNGARARAPE